MKSTELRIDNWVYNSTTKNNMQVYPMMIPQLCRIEKEYGSLKESNIKPILLTEEILLKCGIEVIDDNPKKKPHYNGDVIFKISGLEFSNSMRDSFYCFEFGIEIKHLHQLQNLYHALMGEELEVHL